MGDKIQRKGIAQLKKNQNNKNNKDIFMLVVTKHQLSIIVKHEHKEALLKKWQKLTQKHPLFSYNRS